MNQFGEKHIREKIADTLESIYVGNRNALESGSIPQDIVVFTSITAIDEVLSYFIDIMNTRYDRQESMFVGAVDVTAAHVCFGLLFELRQAHFRPSLGNVTMYEFAQDDPKKFFKAVEMFRSRLGMTRVNTSSSISS